MYPFAIIAINLYQFLCIFAILKLSSVCILAFHKLTCNIWFWFCVFLLFHCSLYSCRYASREATTEPDQGGGDECLPLLREDGQEDEEKIRYFSYFFEKDL